MLSIGSVRSRDCDGVSRRALLKVGVSLPLLAGIPGAAKLLAAEKARAKSVMLVWLNGGPSHLDLFDPKPNAPDQYRGPFGVIPTRTPGVFFSELVPRLAARNDRFSLIRTNVNHSGDHRTAGSIAMCGYTARDGGENDGTPEGYPPSFGSILARHRGYGDLPGYVSLAAGPVGDGQGPMFGQGGGTWGKRHDPFFFNCSDEGQVSIPELKLLDGLSPARLSDRKQLLGELENLRRTFDTADRQKWTTIHQQAYDMVTSIDSQQALDLSLESKQTRARYGRTSFGQSALLGRRLVEAGVPYVQVNWSQLVEVLFPFSDYGWDTHSDNFGLMAEWHGPLLDRTLSVLLDDLEQRGLLETTLVVCMGEFGRTPRINAIGSRDHWHHCYFSIWAGGGVQPGRVVGQSDARGEHPLTHRVTPEMVGTTMLDLAGMHQAARAELNVLPDGRVIDALL